VIAWTLTDTNKHSIAADVAASLFGIGDPSVVLVPVDQNSPLTAAGYGWYVELANGAVTTPFDAFMNWGEGVPTYSPQILVAQLPDDGNLYDAQSSFGPSKFASAAASDTPPLLSVMLLPTTLSFGNVTIGSSSTLSAVLTNSSPAYFDSLKITPDYPNVFTVSNQPAGSEPNAPGEFVVVFTPSSPGYQSGKFTFTATGQYGPVLFTLQFSGTGVAQS
jgi:hypothetical protein